MTPNAQKRLWIVAVLLVVFGGIYWAAPVPAQFRPPMPPVNPPPPFPPGGKPNPPGMPFPPGGNPNGPNNPLQPGIPKGPIEIVKIWTCSNCGAEVGRGDFPPEKCPKCGVQFINGVKPLFGNPPTAPPVGGNPPGFNPNPNPMPPNPVPPNPMQPNPADPPGGVFQPVNNPPASPPPAPTSSGSSSSGSTFFLVVLIIIVTAAIAFVLLGVAGVIFWVRFINQAVEANSTPTARFRPRRRRGTDYSL
jgi:hypothetical protein